MENPRPEKVAVVDEVKSRLTDAEAAVLTDYRGIDVPGMATLRSSLRDAGAEYQIYKNNLVRFAARDLGLEIEEMLVGPTAIAFVRRDSDGDPVLMAKALREFAKVNPNLEVKGGLLGDRPLTAADVDKLAQVAPREELLASLAYGLAAPMVQFAGLLQALPRNFAYGLKALIDQQGGVPATPEPEPEVAATEDLPADEAAVTEAEDAPAEDAPAAEAEAVTETEDAPAEDAPAAEAEGVTETEDAPAAEAEAVTETETETEDAPADEAPATEAETEAPADDAEADDTEAGAASDETDAPADEADADDPAAEDAATTEES
jgi:large subunit ribosomal protein L10